MNIVKKTRDTLRSGGLNAFFGRASSYLETRLMIAAHRLIQNAAMKTSRDAAGIKILGKQAGDLDSMAMMEYFIPKLNQLNSNRHYSAVVLNYLCNAFNLASPIIANSKMQFSPIDEIVYDADIILCNLSMINQVPSMSAKSIENMEVVFRNNTYVIFCKPGLIEPVNGIDVDTDTYVATITENSQKGVKSYIAESGFNFVVREGTVDQSIINEVKHEYIGRLTAGGFTGKNVIDLGGHIGSFSIQITRYLEKNGKVICVEPSPYNVSLIKENIERNKLGDIIQVQQKAVSSKSGKATLYISTDNTGGNKLGMVEPSSKEAVEVDVTTLANIADEFNGEAIDLLKIDVEGSEHSILFPCGDLLKSKVKLVIGEAGSSNYGDALDIISFLQKYDFEVDYEGNAAQLIFIAKNINY